MTPDATWSIGELAARAGVTVKTVRFYSDHGLLPEAGRSAGGHRRYGPGALERIGLIRSLRALGLPVAEVAGVLDAEAARDGLDSAVESAVAGQLREVGSQLAALRWREAALRLVHDCPPGERAERLRLVGAVTTPPTTASLVRFWRRWLPPRLPARVVAAVVEHAVPQPPADPAPAEVLAFARLHALVSGPCTGGAAHCRPAAHRGGTGYRPAVLYEGLPEAYALASAELLARRGPGPGEALDSFVAVHAAACGTRDTPAFRRQLGGTLAADPRIDSYWEQAAVLFGPAAPTPGAAHDWLCAALAADEEPAAAA
ncbi:MerR family transcriptional regulator [Streptomyces sp. NPDC005805]|uniref:MerR family transcriptional regulator n=1 Tax=Streptomyces sp. NPDC005805 TaxID=3157068 RepID=UPI0033F290DF